MHASRPCEGARGAPLLGLAWLGKDRPVSWRGLLESLPVGTPRTHEPAGVPRATHSELTCSLPSSPVTSPLCTPAAQYLGLIGQWRDVSAESCAQRAASDWDREGAPEGGGLESSTDFEALEGILGWVGMLLLCCS
jgi:hypothetical protein